MHNELQLYFCQKNFFELNQYKPDSDSDDDLLFQFKNPTYGNNNNDLAVLILEKPIPFGPMHW